MGTRADFYVGRGQQAEWLGSIAYDGYALDDDAEHPLRLEPATDGYTVHGKEGHWRTAVAKHIAERRDGTKPEQGWPWPWETSHTTDYAYAIDDGVLWVPRFGRRWQALGATRAERDDTKLAPDAFPNMKERQNVTMGERSGVLVLRLPE